MLSIKININNIFYISYLVACLLQLESSMSGESGAGASVGLVWAAIRPLNFPRSD